MAAGWANHLQSLPWQHWISATGHIVGRLSLQERLLLPSLRWHTILWHARFCMCIMQLGRSHTETWPSLEPSLTTATVIKWVVSRHCVSLKDYHYCCNTFLLLLCRIKTRPDPDAPCLFRRNGVKTTASIQGPRAWMKPLAALTILMSFVMSLWPTHVSVYLRDPSTSSFALFIALVERCCRFQSPFSIFPSTRKLQPSQMPIRLSTCQWLRPVCLCMHAWMPLGFMSFRGAASTDSGVQGRPFSRDLSCFLMFWNSVFVSCRLAEAVLVAFCLPVLVSNVSFPICPRLGESMQWGLWRPELWPVRFWILSGILASWGIRSHQAFSRRKNPSAYAGFKNHALIELAPPGSPVVVDPPKETLYYTPPFLPQDP